MGAPCLSRACEFETSPGKPRWRWVHVGPPAALHEHRSRVVAHGPGTLVQAAREVRLFSSFFFFSSRLPTAIGALHSRVWLHVGGPLFGGGSPKPFRRDWTARETLEGLCYALVWFVITSETDRDRTLVGMLRALAVDLSTWRTMWKAGNPNHLLSRCHQAVGYLSSCFRELEGYRTRSVRELTWEVLASALCAPTPCFDVGDFVSIERRRGLPALAVQTTSAGR